MGVSNIERRVEYRLTYDQPKLLWQEESAGRPKLGSRACVNVVRAVGVSRIIDS